MPEMRMIQDNGRKDVVELLDKLLTRARKGEIHSIAVAGLMQGNQVITAFQTASDGDKFGLLGAISHLGHRLNTGLDLLNRPADG